MADGRTGNGARPSTAGGSRPMTTQVTEELVSPFLDDEPAPASDAPVPAPAAAPALPAAPDHGDHEPPVRHPRDLDDRRPTLFARLGGVALAVMIGLTGAALLITWLLGRTVSALNPFDERTVDRSGPAVMVKLSDLKSYQAASGYYEIVIDQETDVSNLPSFLAGERVIFVAAGSVDASIDFSGLGPSSVSVNDGRTSATIRLPGPVLGKPRLDLDRSYVAAHQRGAWQRIEDLVDNRGGGANTEQLYRIAEQRLAAAGSRTGELKQRARTNTRAMLTSMLTSLGFRTVTVTFADER